jgi:transposase-like protein
MTCVFSAPHMQNEEAAYAYVEARIWPNGPVCPHCGGVERIGKMAGKATRIGLHKCYQCRRQFNVKVGTIFEASHLPMTVWLQAMFLMASSKKGISANQLHRSLGVTLKTAWFLSHRIREAMTSGNVSMFGATGGAVEVDEAYIGHQKGKVPTRGGGHKMKVLSLLDRETGAVRSFTNPDLTAKDIHPIMLANIAREARLMTDEARLYWKIGKDFASHESTTHARFEFARGDVTTNRVEGYFSIFKRGMRGIYQHCGEQHLHRYLAEFDFRYTNRIANGINDVERADIALAGVVGKRLTYGTASRKG